MYGTVWKSLSRADLRYFLFCCEWECLFFQRQAKNQENRERSIWKWKFFTYLTYIFENKKFRFHSNTSVWKKKHCYSCGDVALILSWNHTPRVLHNDCFLCEVLATTGVGSPEDYWDLWMLAVSCNHCISTVGCVLSLLIFTTLNYILTCMSCFYYIVLYSIIICNICKPLKVKVLSL